MLIRVDPSRSTPLFAQVADAVRADIAAGDLRSGARLPSARELAAALGVNLHTVLHAYQALRDEGLVQMHRGRGAVVTPTAEQLAAVRDELVALVARARALGLSADAVASLVRAVAVGGIDLPRPRDVEARAAAPTPAASPAPTPKETAS